MNGAIFKVYILIMKSYPYSIRAGTSKIAIKKRFIHRNLQNFASKVLLVYKKKKELKMMQRIKK